MIDLSWNTRGRIGLAEYNKARWRHFAFCLIPLALIIGGSVSLTQLPPWAGVSIIGLGIIVLFYYRFRFMQVIVRRLHDRNFSGMLLIMAPIIQLTILGGILAYVFAAAAGNSVPSWISESGSPLWIWVVLLPVIGFNLFLRYQLSQAGTPGVNRYGPPPGINSAAAVF